MSRKPILSRPRTRIYDSNYNIGHNYYKPVLDSIDRKYSGRSAASPLRTSLPRDVDDRYERAFADEDISSFRKRAESRITEQNMFDSRGGRISDLFENGVDDETSATLKRIRASKKVSVIDDVGMEGAVNNLSARRLVDRSEKILDSVGLSDSRSRDQEISYKRRSLKVSYEDDGNMTKWSPMVREDGGDSSATIRARLAREDAAEESSAAAVRARQSRQRLEDLEDEMSAIAERQAVRERRAARLKALVAESAEETEAAQSALQAVSIRARRTEESVEY